MRAEVNLCNIITAIIIFLLFACGIANIVVVIMGLACLRDIGLGLVCLVVGLAQLFSWDWKWLN